MMSEYRILWISAAPDSGQPLMERLARMGLRMHWRQCLGREAPALLARESCWDIVVSDIPDPDIAPEQLVEIARHEPARVNLLLGLIDGQDEALAERLSAAGYAMVLPRDAVVSQALAIRRALEEAARRTESERRFESFSRSLPVVIFKLDTECHLKFANARWTEMSGQRPAESLGDGWQRALHPKDAGWVVSQCHESLRYRTPMRAEFRIVDAAGNEAWVLGQAQVELDENQQPTGLIGSFTNITEQKEAQRERERLEAQLRHAQKMESVGQLAGGVAHDFNNLLQGILGYTDMALLDMPEGDTRRNDLLEVRRAAERASELTQQLLAFSRRQVLRMVDIDLNKLIGNLLRMLTRLLGEHVEIDFIPGHNLGIIHADRGQLEQVIINLSVNARDAMPEGGRLTIETENVLINGSYLKNHPWARAGRYVLLTVSDTGHGMTADVLEHIFEPFFTTKELGHGTGLGLATVHGIVTQHTGMIHAYSEIGTGTALKIYLPLVERRAAEVGPKIAGAAPGGTETILIAEDEPLVRQLLMRILQTAGYRVYSTVDGQEALELFFKHREEIGLVLLDVVMPKMTGRSVRERILEVHPETKFLFTSGYSQPAGVAGFTAADGVEIIEKPYDAEDLLRRIRRALDDPLQRVLNGEPTGYLPPPVSARLRA